MEIMHLDLGTTHKLIGEEWGTGNGEQGTVIIIDKKPIEIDFLVLP